MQFFQISNGLKIARITQISTSFWRNRSRRPKYFFFENFRAVEEIFMSTKIFSGGAQFSKKKFGAMRSISSKNRWNRSHPRDFWAVQSLKISHAIFWQIRPIVPGFRRIWLQFDQIPGRSAEFTKKWHVDFSSCHMMIWWYDEMTVSYTHLTLPTILLV